MANVEVIRRAIRQNRRLYREHPQSIDEQIEDLVDVTVEVWRLGYGVAIVNQATAELIRAGQGIADLSVWEATIKQRPEDVPEATWGEVALAFLEEGAEKMGEINDLLLIDFGEGEVMLASDLLDSME